MTLSASSDEIIIDGNRWGECTLFHNDSAAWVHQELALDAAEKCLRRCTAIYPSSTYCSTSTEELSRHSALAARAEELSVEGIVYTSCRRDFVTVPLNGLSYDIRGEFLNDAALLKEVDECCSLVCSHNVRIACQQQRF